MRYLRQWHGIPGQNPQFRLRGSLFEPRGFQFIVDYQGFWLPGFQIIDISKIQAYKPPIHQSLLESAVRASNSSIVIEGSGLRASNSFISIEDSGLQPPNSFIIIEGSGFQASNSSIISGDSGFQASYSSIKVPVAGMRATLLDVKCVDGREWPLFMPPSLPVFSRGATQRHAT